MMLSISECALIQWDTRDVGRCTQSLSNSVLEVSTRKAGGRGNNASAQFRQVFSNARKLRYAALNAGRRAWRRLRSITFTAALNVKSAVSLDVSKLDICLGWFITSSPPS